MTNQTKLEIDEEDSLYTIDENEVPPADIVSYNELRSCAELTRLYETDQLNIYPDFQREFVWNNSQQTRFIDSLSKSLPIPSMCLSIDIDTDVRQAIDGLQRIQTIIKFLTNDQWKLSKLEDISPSLSDKTVSQIKKESKLIFSRVENLTIPVTVVRCSYTNKAHLDYLNTIFHRLNTGGMKLSNQEIRNCIFGGSFNTFLKELAVTVEVETVYGHNKGFKNAELLLRLLAFSAGLSEYNGRLSSFLNDFMFKHRDASGETVEGYDHRIRSALAIINKLIPEKKLSKLSMTATEGLVFGVLENLEQLDSTDEDEFMDRFEKFLQLQEFSKEALKEGLAARKSVIARLKAAKEVFGS